MGGWGWGSHEEVGFYFEGVEGSERERGVVKGQGERGELKKEDGDGGG